MTVRRSQAQIWSRLVLAAAMLGIVLFGAVMAGGLFEENSVTVSLIRSEEEMNQDTFAVYIQEVWNAGRVELLEEVMTSGTIYHDPIMASEITGVEGVADYVEAFRTAMPDFSYTVDALSVDGNNVWARLTATGTHTNPLELDDGAVLVPSLNTATWSVTLLSRFEEGKIAETWVQADTLDLMQQLGAMPSLQEQTTVEQNKELVIRLFEEAFNAEEVPPISSLAEFYAESVHFHFANTSDIRKGKPTGRTTHDGWRKNLLNLRRAFPDYEIAIDRVVAENDMVVVHYTFLGTHENTVVTPRKARISPSPDGDNQVGWEGVQMYRIEDGKIKEFWEYWDNELFSLADYEVEVIGQ